MDSELELWYKALYSPHGIEILCSDVNASRARLYKVRKEARDPDLDQISIVSSPLDPDKLWLVKSKGQSDETPRG